MKMCRTTITLRQNQKEFIDKHSREIKNWTLSGFIQEQLDELMHQDSSQLKQMITEKQQLREQATKQIDREIEELRQRYEEQRQKEEQIQKRKQAAMPMRNYDYGR